MIDAPKKIVARTFYLLPYVLIAQASIMSSARTEEAETIASTEKAVSVLILGMSGEAWDKALIWSLVAAAIAAVAVGFTTAGSIIVHKREAEAAEIKLREFQIDVNGRVADAKKEGIEAGRTAGSAAVKAAEANERAGLANARAAALELKAAESNERAVKSEETIANLNLQIEKMRLPRIIDESQAQSIVDSCKTYSSISYSMASVQGNQESQAFMVQLHDVMHRAGWKQIGWSGAGFVGKPRSDMENTGMITATGVVVGYNQAASENTKAAARSLAQSLDNSGFLTVFTVLDDQGNIFETTNDIVVIAVGNKSY